VSALDGVAGAYRIAERLDRLTEDGVENRAIWDLLAAALGALSDGISPRLVTLHFDLRLLGYLGYQPNLESCVGCDRPLEPGENRYSFELGGVICAECRSHDPSADPLSNNALKLLRLMAREDARVVARLRLPNGLLDELETILNRSLRLTTDRDFAAPAVLRSLHGEE
jgi:DNA repair protein RecO (recombination protein O)